LSFGNVTIDSSSAAQTVTLTNTGNTNVSISQINVSGAGFSVSGFTPPLALAAGQSTTFGVIFDPTTSGSLSGAVSVVSNATNTPTIVVSGTGMQTVSHSATLNWAPSTSTVMGYYIYRGARTGGPYAKLNATPVSLTTYTDSAVQAGQTYFYVATAVDSTNVESTFSNETTATIPTP
jgi:HYDIN/CFA65/VesB-like, Ig-like domain